MIPGVCFYGCHSKKVLYRHAVSESRGKLQDRVNDSFINVFWNENSLTQDVLTIFYNKLNTLINKHARMKIMSNRKAKQFCKPWITKGPRISFKIKNKLYASGNAANYNIYRNKICT